MGRGSRIDGTRLTTYRQVTGNHQLLSGQHGLTVQSDPTTTGISECHSNDLLTTLRRVEYSFNYSVMRLLNDEEIRIMYKQDYKNWYPMNFGGYT